MESRYHSTTAHLFIPQILCITQEDKQQSLMFLNQSRTKDLDKFNPNNSI